MTEVVEPESSVLPSKALVVLGKGDGEEEREFGAEFEEAGGDDKDSMRRGERFSVGVGLEGVGEVT